MTVQNSGDDYVVLVNQYADGTTVRWFKDLWSAERNHTVLTATAYGVKPYGLYLHEVPSKWLEDANEAYQKLSADPEADMTYLATHRNQGPSNGPLVKVKR